MVERVLGKDEVTGSIPVNGSTTLAFEGAGMSREIITFQCTECKNKNYTNTKNKKLTTERLEFKKFCPFCRQHKPHKEIK